MSGKVVFGLALAIGLPLVVLVVALFWPQRIPKDRSVSGIRQRIEEGDVDG
ncbi:hypothetical protein [Nocardia sp. NPDC050175]|uniref:hypothetical protein n=1 Tax=Nocardia sp. NPDC050175 TaxID=3364317 RepID=UPI00379C7D9E